MEQLDWITVALSHVLDRPVGDFPADANLKIAGVDSIALVVLADVIEAQYPDWLLPDSVLKSARTVADLAAGLVKAA